MFYYISVCTHMTRNLPQSRWFLCERSKCVSTSKGAFGNGGKSSLLLFYLGTWKNFVPFPFFWNQLSCLLSPFPPFIFVIISNFLHVPFPSFVLIRKYTHILVVSRSLFVSTFLLHHILLLLSFRDLVDVVKTASSYRWTQVFLNFSLILLLFCGVLFARYCVMWLPMNNTYININAYNDICKWLSRLKNKIVSMYNFDSN